MHDRGNRGVNDGDSCHLAILINSNLLMSIKYDYFASGQLEEP